jgi:hypothetical protein
MKQQYLPCSRTGTRLKQSSESNLGYKSAFLATPSTSRWSAKKIGFKLDMTEKTLWNDLPKGEMVRNT